MGFQIEDGKGRGFVSSVSDVNRLNVSAKAQDRIYYISRDSQLAFSWDSTFGATSGNTVLYLKNTSTSRNFFVNRFELASEVANKFEVYKTAGTPAGTIVSGANLNLSSNLTADASAYGNGSIAGLTNDPKLATVRSPANATEVLQFGDAVILGFNDALSVQVGATGSVDITVVGYFENR